MITWTTVFYVGAILGSLVFGTLLRDEMVKRAIRNK